MKIKRKSRTSAEKKKRRMNLGRQVLSIVLLLLCGIPMLGGGVQALGVIPAAICISMNEDVYFSMFAGVLSGLMIDLACGGILCANAMFLVCFCTFVSLLFASLLRHTFLNYLLVLIVGTFGRAGIGYLLTQVLFQREGREIYWQNIQIPSCLLTLLAGVVVYWLFLPLNRLLTRQVKSMDAAAIYREN